MNNTMQNQCPEFPYFGAWYPDARCINGYLWDMDKCDENGLYSTGDNPPCPFCNMEEYIEDNYPDFVNDDFDYDEATPEMIEHEEMLAREQCREVVLKLHEKYNYKHS